MLGVDRRKLFEEKLKWDMSNFHAEMKKLEQAYDLVFDSVKQTLSMGMFQVDCSNVRSELLDFFTQTKHYYLQLLKEAIQEELRVQKQK